IEAVPFQSRFKLHYGLSCSLHRRAVSCYDLRRSCFQVLMAGGGCRAALGLDPSASLRAGSRGRPSPHEPIGARDSLSPWPSSHRWQFPLASARCPLLRLRPLFPPSTWCSNGFPCLTASAFPPLSTCRTTRSPAKNTLLCLNICLTAKTTPPPSVTIPSTPGSPPMDTSACASISAGSAPVKVRPPTANIPSRSNSTASKSSAG